MQEDVLYGWEGRETKDLFKAVLKLKNVKESEDFFRDLMTLHEIDEMAKRWQIVQLVDKGVSYLDISEQADVSTSTVTRVAHWLKHGRGGYRAILDRI